MQEIIFICNIMFYGQLFARKGWFMMPRLYTFLFSIHFEGQIVNAMQVLHYFSASEECMYTSSAILEALWTT